MERGRESEDGKGSQSGKPHPEDPVELPLLMHTLPPCLSVPPVKRKGLSAVSGALRVACPALVFVGAALSDFLQSPLPASCLRAAHRRPTQSASVRRASGPTLPAPPPRISRNVPPTIPTNHPSRSPEHHAELPVPHSSFPLAVCFPCSHVYTSVLLSQLIAPLPSLPVSVSPFSMSASLFPPCKAMLF